MKLKSGFMLRKVGGQWVVAALGEAGKSFSGIIRLNDTGKFLWERLSKDVTEDELCRALCGEFDVSADQARTDTAAFLSEIRNAKLLE